MSLKETPEWELGEVAVNAVRRWRLDRGDYLLRTDLIEMGGAPGFVGRDGRVPVPDLLAASNGQTRWHEVKWKTSCVLYQSSKPPSWRHGIDRRAWDHYLWVQNATSIQGWLDIVQLRPGPNAEPDPVLLTAPLDLLCHRLHPHAGAGDVKVWWQVDDFAHYPIRVEDDWRRVDVGPRIVRPWWEQAGQDGDAPRWRPRPVGLFE